MVFTLAVSGLLVGAGNAVAATDADSAPTLIEKSEGWLGVLAPELSKFEITGEFLDPKSDRYVYRPKAIVRRAGSDRNGQQVFARAGTLRAQLDELDKRLAARGKVQRGFFRDSVIKTSGLSARQLRTRLPALKANYEYRLLVRPDGRRGALANPKARHANGPESFVWPLSVWPPPGDHKLSLIACAWPDESHPLGGLFVSIIRNYGTKASVTSIIRGFLTGGAAGAGRAVAKELVKVLGANFVINAATCSGSLYEVSVLAKVPRVVGVDTDVARDAIEKRRLKFEADPILVTRATCRGVSDRVKRQSPERGTRLERGATVTVSAQVCVEKKGDSGGSAPPLVNWAGAWTTDFGQLTLKQDKDGIVTGTYPFDDGRIEGTIKGNILEGTFTENRNNGGFFFRLSDDGKSFTGSWRNSKNSSAPPGKWNGKRA